MQNGSKAEVECILRDDTHNTLVSHGVFPLSISNSPGRKSREQIQDQSGLIRFWISEYPVAELNTYAALKNQVFHASSVPNFVFRYNDNVTGDANAAGYLGSHTARLVEPGTASERIELYVNTITFYEPSLKVQDWGRISYFAKPRKQKSQISKGQVVEYDVLVQTRVEILCCGPNVGNVIEDNAFFLQLGGTARAFVPGGATSEVANPI